MDQPFDTANYLRSLGRRWPLILAPALIAVAVAAALGFFMPVRYTATVTMIAPKQQLVWRWNNKLYDLVDIRFDWRNEVMSLAKQKMLAERALDKVGSELQSPMSVEELQAATTIRPKDGASLFSISVKASTPEDAALLANAMAQSLPEIVADLYTEEIESAQQALEEARQGFQEWDEALVEFRSRTGVGLEFSGALATSDESGVFGVQSFIKQQLTLKNSTRAALQDLVERIDHVIQTAEESSGSPAVGLLDTREMAAYGPSFEQLREMAANDPDALIATLQSVRAQIQNDLDRVTEEALALQAEHARHLQEKDHILQQRGKWQASVSALEDRELELRLKRLIQGERVRVVDEASPPERPSQPNWPLYIGLALVGGLLLGFLLAVAAVYLAE